MSYADEIKAAVSTRELCERLGLTIDRSGNMICPFHGDKNASLKVYADPARGWHCFGCHRGGSVIDFAMEYYELDYKQAAMRLAYDFGLSVPVRRTLTAKEREKVRQELERKRQAKEAWTERWKTAQESWKQAFARWLDLCHQRDETRPQAPENAFTAQYAYALQLLPDARYDLELAEHDLMEIERERVDCRDRAAG